MKIILLKDHPKLGQKNSVVKVSDGYGYNFLIPQKLGVVANDKNLKDLEKDNSKKLDNMKLEVKKYLEVKKNLEKIVFTEKVKFTKGGDLIKSISKKHLATIIEKQSNIKLDKSVFPNDYVFASGKNTIPLKLFPEIVAQITLELHEEVNG